KPSSIPSALIPVFPSLFHCILAPNRSCRTFTVLVPPHFSPPGSVGRVVIDDDPLRRLADATDINAETVSTRQHPHSNGSAHSRLIEQEAKVGLFDLAGIQPETFRNKNRFGSCNRELAVCCSLQPPFQSE